MVGIYEGGETLKASTVKSHRYQSDYAVQYQGLVRDDYDKIKGDVTSHPAIINDSLDKARNKCDWYVHPDYPDLLLVITIKEVTVGDQLFIPYAPEYWWSDKYSIETLAAAVIRYKIDIWASPHWRKLQKYPDL